MNNTLIETWNNWNTEIHEEADSLKRIKSAGTAKLTPVQLHPMDGMGYFQGGHGRYETFLDYCPCGDFRRRKLPCKHIYRLAMELNLFEGNYSSDSSKIVVPKSKDGLSLPAAVEIVEDLPDETQMALYRHLSSFMSGTYRTCVARDAHIDLLLCQDILTLSDIEDSELLLSSFTRAQLMNKLDSLDISYKKSMKLNELKNIFQTSFSSGELRDIFSDIVVVVSLAERFTTSRRKLYTYLLRKFCPGTSYYELDGVLYEFTREEKDDEITDLLRQYGYAD